MTAKNGIGEAIITEPVKKRPDLWFLAMLFVVASPSNLVASFSLIFFLSLPIYWRKVKIYPLELFALISMLTMNAVSGIVTSGVYFSVNFALSILFYFPLIFLLVFRPSFTGERWQKYDLKKTIELFLLIEIIVSACTGTFFYFFGGHGHGGIDIDFGDVIAGTFRIPLMYYPDSATKVFASSIILVTFLYISYYRKRCNKMILALVVLVIFVGAVNHLILAVFLSLFLALSLKKPLWVISAFGTLLFLYVAVSPHNLAMMQERLSLLWDALSSLRLSDLSLAGPKGDYIVDYFRDFSLHPYYFSFTGVGLGQYSDRAAMYLTGAFAKMPFSNISSWMKASEFPLYASFVNRPDNLKGDFFLPYNAVFSLLAEFGLLFSFIVVGLFIRRVNKVGFFPRTAKVFIVTFTILIGFVDHYYEYSQTWFLFVILLFNLVSEYEIHSKKRPVA